MATFKVDILHSQGADNYVCESFSWSAAALADFEIEEG